MRIQYVHFTVSAAGDFRGVCKTAHARWLWQHLRRGFPNALAVVLMPDHFHIVTPYENLQASLERLNRILGHFKRVFGKTFEEADIELCTTMKILMRTVRYVLLNPCRGLVDDPCEWPWSTHRDVVGSVLDPWVSAERLADSFGRPHEGFVEWFHRYVSSDKDVAFEGTPAPQPAAARIGPGHSLADVARAAASATRATPADVQRSGATRDAFILLARSQGWRHTEQLAEAAKVHVSAVRWIGRKHAPELLRAALLCLGDKRLHRFAA